MPGVRETPCGRRSASGWVPILPVPDDAPVPPSSHHKRGKPTRVETYRDAAGAVLGQVLRFDLPGGADQGVPAPVEDLLPALGRAGRFDLPGGAKEAPHLRSSD